MFLGFLRFSRVFLRFSRVFLGVSRVFSMVFLGCFLGVSSFFLEFSRIFYGVPLKHKLFIGVCFVELVFFLFFPGGLPRVFLGVAFYPPPRLRQISRCIPDVARTFHQSPKRRATCCRAA